MTDPMHGNGDRFDADLGRALRRAEAEARPREEFRLALRERFAEGALAPGSLRPAEATSTRPVRALPVPRWVAYPAAAAVLVAALAASGALGRRAEPEAVLPAPARPSPGEAALVAADRRLASVEVLRGRTWQHRVVEGRPWLLPAEAAFADPAEIRELSLYMAQAEEVLGVLLPEIAARPALPTVTLVAPDRRAFEALAASRVAPMALGANVVAAALPEAGVLLLAPGALEPGGPSCEEMEVAHEAVHAWLHARRRGREPLPLWAEEGLAGVVSETASYDTDEWCRRVLGAAESACADPFIPDEVLGFREYAEMARHTSLLAPCRERPYSMVPVFHAHAESLVRFLLEEHPGCVHRAAFQTWLADELEGRQFTPRQTADALGFATTEGLFFDRDDWLAME